MFAKIQNELPTYGRDVTRLPVLTDHLTFCFLYNSRTSFLFSVLFQCWLGLFGKNLDKINLCYVKYVWPRIAIFSHQNIT